MAKKKKKPVHYENMTKEAFLSPHLIQIKSKNFNLFRG